jgi:hypothetical protein
MKFKLFLFQNAFSICTVIVSGIFSTGVFIWNKSHTETIKEFQALQNNAKIEMLVKQSLHADSLANSIYDNQKIMIANQVKGAKKDSIMRQSIIDLGAKVLTKEEFHRFTEPYLGEKKKFKSFEIQSYCLR